MPLDITALYAGLLTLWVLTLAALVGRARTVHKVSIGDGGVRELSYLVRAHGNAVESIPLALILLGLAESFDTPGWVVHILGIALVAGRLMHGLCFLKGGQDMMLRGLGMMLTMGMMFLTALGLIGHGVTTMIWGTA